jgi:hypothetical protein
MSERILDRRTYYKMKAPPKDLIIAAKLMKQLYDSFIRAGFTEDQALKLVICNLNKNKGSGE